MRPPPLALQCAPSRAWRQACAALGAAAAAALAAWAAGHLGGPGFAVAAAAAAGAAAGVALGLHLAGPMRPAQIRWDGQAWQVDDVGGELQVMLDFGSPLLLLRLRPAGPGPGPVAARWLALSFAGRAVEHRALRTALYSRPPAATLTLPPVRPPGRASD